MNTEQIIAGLETEVERLRGKSAASADLLARADVLLADVRPHLIAGGRWRSPASRCGPRSAIPWLPRPRAKRRSPMPESTFIQASTTAERKSNMRNVYLAARYSRRTELCQYAEMLRSLGCEITSRWLEGNHQVDDRGLSTEAKAGERERFATEDWEDLMRADTCISFTEAPRSTNTRGGRHVEFGAALAVGKKCIVIGPRENVFHCLPSIDWFGSWTEWLSVAYPAIEID